MKSFNIILITLSLNLLFTNTMLMLDSRPHNTVMAVGFVILAITYSIASALTIRELGSKLIFAIFAALDGIGMVIEFAPHGTSFQSVVAVYFGLYTSFIVFIAPMVKDAIRIRVGSETESEKELQCSLDIQRERARDAEKAASELRKELELYRKAAQEKAAQEEQKKVADMPAIPAVEPAPAKRMAICASNAQESALSDEESAELLSIKRSFARCKDEIKRREKVSEIKSERVKALISELYKIY